MKIGFLFGVLIALVSVTNGYVVTLTRTEKNSSQVDAPNIQKVTHNIKHELPKKVAQNRTELNQQTQNISRKENPVRNRNEQDLKPNQPQKENKDPAQNLNQQDSKKNQKQQKYENPGASRRSSNMANYKRFEVRKRSKDAEALRLDNETPELRSRDQQEVESIIMAIDTGAQQPRGRTDKYRAHTDPLDSIGKLFEDLTKTHIPSSVIYRAKKDLDVKPSFVRFRSSSQPSLKLEVTSSSIVKALETLLAHPDARRYADVIGQQAAEVYRTLSNDKAQDVKNKNLDNFGYAERSTYDRQ